jgi:hypothetical protein
MGGPNMVPVEVPRKAIVSLFNMPRLQKPWVKASFDLPKSRILSDGNPKLSNTLPNLKGMHAQQCNDDQVEK